jgi:hypothetical protein
MSKKLAYGLVAAAFLGGLVAKDLIQSTLFAQPIVAPGAAPVTSAAAPPPARGPEWSHGLMLRARKADQKDFDATTPRIGVEVFTDMNNGNLIYITDGGAIAVVKK